MRLNWKRRQKTWRKRRNIVRLNIAHVTERQNTVSVADPDLQIIGGGGGGGGRSPKNVFWPFGPQFGLKIVGTRAPRSLPWICHWVYHVSAEEASCGDGHIMLVSSKVKIKTKWGYVPILGQFVDFNSFYCPHLPTFLTQMRKIFILSWPEFQKNVPATEDFRQFSEDFLTLTKMSGDFQTTFEHFRSYLMLFRRLSNWLLKRRKK